MNTIKNDVKLIAYCGLYCGACGKFINGKCPGCAENAKATWCGNRNCCIKNGYASCADCKEYKDVMQCKNYNSFMAKVFGFIFKSDRAACISLIKEKRYEGFSAYMSEKGWQSIKKA
jgi:hypothetical protein